MKSATTWMGLVYVLVMVFAIIPDARAKTTTVDGITWTYSVKNGEAVLEYHTVPTSTSGSITIPSALDGYRVTSIGKQAFDGCSRLTGATIPDGVTDIGNYAFRNCSGLSRITIPDGVTNIGDYAFDGCLNLASASLPDQLTRIGTRAFFNCSSLTSVEIPDGVTNIGSWTFSGCSGLSSVTIPDSVTNIGSWAFSGCSGLSSVTIPGSVTSIGFKAFSDCSNLESVTIRNGVTSIGGLAFSACRRLTDLPIPDSVTRIGSRAFLNCSGLTNIVVDSRNLSYSSLDGVLFSRDKTSLIVFPGGKPGTYAIPDSVTNLAYGAFYRCNKLTNIVVDPQNLSYSSLDGVLFSRDKTSLIVFPGGRQGGYAIPEGITSADFSGCTGLERVTIPESVTSIGVDRCTRLEAIEVADGNASYASRDGVLFSKNMEILIRCPGGKTGVYSIPDGVKTIRSFAFSWCTGVKSLVVPSSLQSIGDYAFLGCSGIETLFLPSSWEGKSLMGTNIRPKCRILYGTAGTECVGETEWQFFTQDGFSTVLGMDGRGEVSIPGQLGGCPVTGIAPHAFHGCEGMTGADIPAGVTNIGNHAFCGCGGLGDVEIPSGVTEIGDFAFAGCKGLTNVVIPDTVQRIGQHAFHGCTGLTGLTMGSGVAEIGKWAFAKCSRLPELVLPDGVARLGDFAFAGCDGLESATIPASVTEVGVHPFAGCKGLQEIAVESGNGGFESQDGVLFSKGKAVLVGVPAGRDGVLALPDEVEEIGGHAFDGCAGLTMLEVGDGNAVFASRDGALFSKDMAQLLACPAGKAGTFAVPGGVERIEDRAFADCRKLTRILMPESVTSLGRDSLYRCSGVVALFVPEVWEDARVWKDTCLQAGVKIISGKLESEIVDGVEWHFFREVGGAVVLPGDYGADVKIPEVLGGRPVTGIGEYAFYGCVGVEKVEMPGIVKNIGDYAFYGCEGLECVELPDSVRSIGKWAFGGCKGLKHVSIPDGVASIGDRAFFGCNGLPEALIPDSVRRIGVNAFFGNGALTALEVGGDNAYYASREGVLFSKDMEKLLWCPDGKTGDYSIPDGVKSLAYRAFGDCAGLTRGTLPESVEIIGRNAFYGCRGMRVLYVPASWEGEPEWLDKLARAKLPEECRIVYLKDNPGESTSTTPVPVTFKWLEENAKGILEENGGDYEAAANATAANGRPVWACYVADLDPTDARAELRMEWVDGGPVYGPISGKRVYILEGSEDLNDPEGWSSPTNARQRYFRVRVELP